ncbi:transcription termination/antitermination protein NusG [Pararhizobium haloflavum]|uniref:transcription termination/antitermination protein NusG n=1 Tax=Pararhizobium haloflavum TaxID=2037914 RepID=UPI000C186908|nr:transcription termination/antitermination NusG family protein [Pararhizobium haloflavum]
MTMMHQRAELSERELQALERGRRKAELIAWLQAEAAARDGDMAWYVARTTYRADTVAGDLRDRGIEAVCPTERRWKRYPRSRAKYSVEYPLFGHYLFVRLLMAESAWVGLMTFDGIHCLQGNGERPVPVRTKEIEQILELASIGAAEPVSEIAPIMVGDQVVHPVGTFAELVSHVVEIDARKREALVSTLLFGREIETRCALDDLARLT